MRKLKKKVKLTGRSWRCCVSCNRRSSRQGGRKKGERKILISNIDSYLHSIRNHYLSISLVYIQLGGLSWGAHDFPHTIIMTFHSFTSFYVFDSMRTGLSLSLAGEMFSAKKLKFSANSCLSSLLQLSSRLSRSMDDGWCMVLSMPNAIAITVRKRKKNTEWKVHMKEKNMSNICENKRRNPHVHVKKKREGAHSIQASSRCALVKFAVLSGGLFCLTHGSSFIFMFQTN